MVSIIDSRNNDVVADDMVDNATNTHWGALKSAYLDAYAIHGTYIGSARVAGVGVTTVDRWVESDPEFAAEFKLAHRRHREQEEELTLKRRVYESNCPPLLVIFYMKAIWREKYDDNVKPANSDASDLLRRLEAMDAKTVKRAVLEDVRGGANALGAERMFDTNGQSAP